MTARRISETLVADGGMIRCRSCNDALAPVGEGWKAHAALSSVSVRGLPGAGSAVEERVVLRRFACPGCGALLDTEIALPEDPFLEDRVAV
jgi:acetone carboxylase gamma subunit